MALILFFRLRERDDCSYAICLSFESTIKHYRIDILPSGNFCIQDGPQFQSIIAVSIAQLDRTEQNSVVLSRHYS